MGERSDLTSGGGSGDDRAAALEMPPGAPAWITPGLVALTLKIFRVRYGKAHLSAADAVQILVGVGRLVDVLFCPAEG